GGCNRHAGAGRLQGRCAEGRQEWKVQRQVQEEEGCDHHGDLLPETGQEAGQSCCEEHGGIVLADQESAEEGRRRQIVARATGEPRVMMNPWGSLALVDGFPTADMKAWGLVA